ncbi:MAG: FHA domain-containing protein [Dehalococcoidia bacterium]|nr:FHA domain-containing protein [Dehalococcoidia bacterium]
MSEDVTILVVRLAVLALVYLFLVTVIRTVARQLTRARPITAGPADGSAALLYVVQAGKTGLRAGDPFQLEPSTTIGREKGNGVVLDEDTVSSRHAAVEFHDGRWWLRDLGSTNGTLLNNEPVEEQYQLRPGDLIQIGAVRLQFAASNQRRR